ncbi:MAG: ATP-binding protein [Urechidicola sp.]|nr:ATP-binding protein [Urechidicola sp.]
MKSFFSKSLIVALIFINATISFAQNLTKTDSLIGVVNEYIKIEDYLVAEKLVDSLKETPQYQIDSVKLAIDFTEAILYMAQNKDDIALEILLNGLSQIKENQKTRYKAEYAYEIGSGFSKLKKHSLAIKYFRMVYSYGFQFNDSLEVSKGSLGVGNQHYRLYVALLSEKEKDTLKMQIHKDSLNHYWGVATSYFPKKKKDKTILGYVYDARNAFNYYEDNFEKAEYFGQKALEIWENSADSISMVNTLNIMGALNWKKQDYNKSIAYYSRGLKLVENGKSYMARKSKRIFLANLAQSYSHISDYKNAYDFRTESVALAYELSEETAQKEYVEIEAKYNFAKKEKLAEIEKNKRKNAELWLYIVGVSTTVMLLFVWLFYRGQKVKREKKLLVLQKETLVKEREIEQLNTEAQIKILNATIDGKETERQQIAEILHNSVSALLSSAGLHLQAAKIELKENAPEEISKSQAIVEEAGDKIRDLSHQLISPVLMKFGLGFAMDDLCEKYSNSKLSFKCESENIQRYSSDFEIKIHSIIDELVNNVIKHSDATEAQILLKDNEKYFKIKIIDNGKGFDINKVRAKYDVGLGLPQIEARVKMMDGIFEIKSSKEMGTHIYMKLPVPK